MREEVGKREREIQEKIYRISGPCFKCEERTTDRSEGRGIPWECATSKKRLIEIIFIRFILYKRKKNTENSIVKRRSSQVVLKNEVNFLSNCWGTLIPCLQPPLDQPTLQSVYSSRGALNGGAIAQTLSASGVAFSPSAPPSAIFGGALQCI